MFWACNIEAIKKSVCLRVYTTSWHEFCVELLFDDVATRPLSEYGTDSTEKFVTGAALKKQPKNLKLQWNL
jgi:hypothetical protein